MLPLYWKNFATPTAPDKNRSFGYRWDDALLTTLDTKDGPLVTIPQYYRLGTDAGKEAEWVAVLPQTVPDETGLKEDDLSDPPEHTPSEPYLTPDDPTSCRKKPGRVAGPFRACPGHGSVVTYYWYRFADQPALLNADMTDEERERMQERVEKLHRTWTKDRDYLPPPALGELDIPCWLLDIEKRDA